jgi:hypothetical protein
VFCGSIANIRRFASGALAERWTPYLYELHGPGFDVPLTLWNTTDIIVDEETFSCDSEN